MSRAIIVVLTIRVPVVRVSEALAGAVAHVGSDGVHGAVHGALVVEVAVVVVVHAFPAFDLRRRGLVCAVRSGLFSDRQAQVDHC